MEILNPKYTRAEAEWRAKARCAGLDTNEFFPAMGVNIRHIKEFCFECPVVVECGDWAIENRIEHGVWGGLSFNEREAIWLGRKERPRAALRD